MRHSKPSSSRWCRDVKPVVEKFTGKKLSNNEVVDIANNTSKVLHSTVSREQTAAWEASLLKARQELARSAQSGTVDKSYIDNLVAVKSHATDIARKLQSFSIGADPSLTTNKDRILSAVTKVESDTNKILEAANGVDFNDAQQAANFYRKFVKAKAGEYVDLLRYNSMLSSPNTHINNAFGNVLSTAVVAPLEKTITGAVDFLGSTVTGKPRTAFAGEGAAYTGGYYSKVGDAAHRFADVMRGKSASTNLDIRSMPLSTEKGTGKALNMLSYPTKLLEASDQFFTALTQGGEEAALKYRQAKGGKVGDIGMQASKDAAYRLYRSDLNDPKQGHLLNAVDFVTSKIQEARSHKNPVVSTIAKYSLPFVKTPMNILKQGIEYSPAGVATLPGAANKTEQISKAILGSTAAAATAMLAASGRTTWAEPTDPTKKQAFRAAGMQPYAVKIGDQWVSYTKLPPAMSFNIALVSAIHDAQENKKLDDSDVNSILSGVAKWGNFFADQSYVKNIGDLVAATKGDPGKFNQFVSNYPQQLVPFRALLGWMARVVDPYQRQVDYTASFWDQQVQQLMTQIPFASGMVPARMDKFGEPIPNQNRELNAFSPLKVTNERPDQKQYYDTLVEKSRLNRELKSQKTAIEQGNTPAFGQAAAAELTPAVPNQKSKAQEDIAKLRVKLKGGQIEANGKLVYKDGDSVKTVQLDRKIEKPKLSGQKELDKKRIATYKGEITSKINDIVTLNSLGKLTDAEAEKRIEALKAEYGSSTGRGGRGSKTSKKTKALLGFQANKSLALSKLFLSGVKNTPATAVSNVTKLQRRRPSNTGLKNIQDIVRKSESIVKNKKGRTIQALSA
jgi:hypothetical protein